MNDKTIALMCRIARVEMGEPRRVIAETAKCSIQNVKAFEEARSHSSDIFYIYLARYPRLRSALFSEGATRNETR